METGQNGMHEEKLQEQQKQKVVILAGPHKTATSETQRFLIRLQRDKDLLAPFQWPLTPEKHTNSKQFSDLVKELYVGQENATLLETKNARKYRKGKLPYIEHYRNEFQRIWQQNNNKNNSILVGAELLGPLALHKHGPAATQELIKLMPWSNNNIREALGTSINNHGGEIEYTTDYNDKRKDRQTELPVTVALNYRTPRFDHLASVWQQAIKVKKAEIGTSFHDWMCQMDCTLPEPKLNLRVINTLGQALAYSNFNGVSDVVVVDMAGAKAHGYDVREVYACDVLNLDACKNESSYKVLLEMKDDKRAKKTKKYSFSADGSVSIQKAGKNKEEDTDTTDPSTADDMIELKEQINLVLRKLDCSYYEVITAADSGIRFLYSSYNTSYCPEKFRNDYLTSLYTDQQACLDIQDVLKCPALSPSLLEALQSLPTNISEDATITDNLSNAPELSDAAVFYQNLFGVSLFQCASVLIIFFIFLKRKLAI